MKTSPKEFNQSKKQARNFTVQTRCLNDWFPIRAGHRVKKVGKSAQQPSLSPHAASPSPSLTHFISHSSAAPAPASQSPLLPAGSLQQPSLLSIPFRVILLEYVLLIRMVGQLLQTNIKGFRNPFSLSSLIHKILKEERTTEIILHQPALFTNVTQKTSGLYG